MPSSCSRALRNPDRELTADPADTSMDNSAWKLFEFLKCMSQDIWKFSTSYATEQAQAKEETLGEHDLIDCIYEKALEWSQANNSQQEFYNEAALKLNETIWDRISRDENGVPKEITFHQWSRKVAKHAQPSGAASEHADYTTEENPKSYKSLAVEMLQVDTTAEQRRKPKYKINRNKKTGEVQITNPQRSWINVMLFKNFGHTRVAYFILNHGVPAILDLPLRRKALTKAKVLDMLEEFMFWHASLLQSLLDREEHPDMEYVRKLSALSEQKWQMQRREEKRKHSSD